MRIKNINLIGASEDLSSGFNSDAIWLGHIAQYSIQIAYTGNDSTPLSGTFKLQGSNDFGRESVNRADSELLTNWTDIDNSSVSVSSLSDSPTTELWNEGNVGYRWVRLVWVASSGDGSLTSARANLKGI